MGRTWVSGRGGIARKLSRREFLKVGGAGLAGAAILGSSGCGGGQGGGAEEIVFSFFPDPSGSVQALIDRFNEENEVQVRLREMPADSGQHFDQLNTEFQSGEINIDVIGGDVIWPAQFAANGFIADLSDRFTEDERGAFLPAPIEANTYEGRIYGVPWYTDAGMLYYRRDLLEAAGFSRPPGTWDELKQQARAVQEQAGTRYGYVFQGAEYEGGVVNALEYIWNSGGDVLEGEDQVVIDSPEARRGLEIQRSMVSEGVAPEGVSQYKEQESATLFLSGEAVFMRNVPRMYALASDPAESNIDPGQIGIAALPVAEEGLQSYSSLGGWNLFMNANARDPDAAYEFIRFMSDPEQQKFRSIEGSVLPSRQELYEDEDVLQNVRVAELGQDAIQNTRPRPVSPFYSDMSLRMAEQFIQSLRGDIPPEEALATLQGQLEEVIEQGRQQRA
ncbi:MAG: Maltodextrin ABC transporter, substrate-binding protein MdxE [uncultured Rubrobacteraceae bacterium]|uniref:Maltodextrin ABC transporter, substrate-binding protein MdxE n=1 Tax=uncultured Rubrobacteraceae bacterium TaxID=349277 RepID=A0A6J4QLR0_9ACTN|nr:MAG: Maltodextrin ABC transporter, substrate-binding protein MdxE [uncultured Rubrobacteraceae bacterium]